MLNLLVVSHPDYEILGYEVTGYLEQKKEKITQPVNLKGETEERQQLDNNLDFYIDIQKANIFHGFNEPIIGNFRNLKLNTLPHILIVNFIEKNIIKFQRSQGMFYIYKVISGLLPERF